MRDRAGNELEIGDSVLYLEPGRSSSRLVWGVVALFTPKMVWVRPSGEKKPVLRERTSVVKPFVSPDE